MRKLSFIGCLTCLVLAGCQDENPTGFGRLTTAVLHPF